MNQKLMTIADKVIKACKANDIHVLRYDATSSNSIYLKFDYGVANSLRISDHAGKKYLKYRYNITSGDVPRTARDRWPRYYYSTSKKSVDGCIAKILSERDEKIQKYGADRYQAFTMQNKADKSGAKGFWSKAVAV